MSDWTTDRWREKYYDKVEELNRVEAMVTGGMAVALARIKDLEAALKRISEFTITRDKGRFGEFIGAGAVDIARDALKNELQR